jgi:AraC-like DNA-binding protein
MAVRSTSPRSGADPTVLSSWVQVLLAAFRAHGGDVQTLLSASGFSERAFDDPSGRHPLRDVVALWARAVELTGDSTFGLKVPKHVQFTTFHALGYAVLASPTLGEALDRITRYSQVVTDSGLLKLELREDEVLLHIIPIMTSNHGEAFRDSVLSTTVRVLRILTAGALTIERVTLNRRSKQPLEPYEKFFRCPVARGENDTLHFEAELLHLRLASSNPELAKHNDDAVRGYLARVATGSVVDRARAAIAELEPRSSTPQRVAQKLGMGLRSLQRRLHEHGTNYESLLADLRFELARALLRERRSSIDEIAFALGYESQTAFARAFKRWTGVPPSEYVDPHRTTRDPSGSG